MTGPTGRSPRRVHWRAVLVLLALVRPPATADAHAVLLRAVPPPRATLRVPPPRAQLWFSERLEPAYSTVSIWNEHAEVAAGKTAVSVDDPRLLSIELPPLPSGAYTVRYRVLSVDGHVVAGTYSFTITGGTSRR